MSAANESRIELKVGALIVVCLVLLVGFLFLLGDWRLGEASEVVVDWDTSGGLKVGAPVRVAGIEAGRVESVEFKGGEVDPAVDRPVYIRVTLSLKPEVHKALREDADFYITTQGLLGEKYVEIDPGRSKTALPDKPTRGVEPMRLEKIAAKVETLIGTVNELVVDNRANITGAITEAKGTMEDARALVKDVRGAVAIIQAKGVSVMDTADKALKEYTPGSGATGDNIKAATASAKNIAASVDTAIGDGSEIQGLITDARATTKTARAVVAKVEPKLNTLSRKANSLMDNANSLIVESRPAVVSTVKRADAAIKKAEGVLDDVKVVSGKLKDGEGTIGALLNDRELFDDAREIMKDLKRHPWKFLWKE